MQALEARKDLLEEETEVMISAWLGTSSGACVLDCKFKILYYSSCSSLRARRKMLK